MTYHPAMASPDRTWQLHPDSSQAYHRYIGKSIVAPWTEDLIEAAGIRRGHRVLDVACGTGLVTREADRRVGEAGRVVGLDVNRGMLDVARSMRGQRIEWQGGDAAEMPFGSSEFDVVLCQQGLQFFADKSAALKEMNRVLRPGGRVALNVFRSIEHCPWHRAVADALERHVSLEAAEVVRWSFSLGDRDELRGLIAGAAFREAHIRIEGKWIRHPSIAEFLPGYLASTPVADLFTDDEVLSVLVKSVTDSLCQYMDDDGLAAPVQCHVITARK